MTEELKPYSEILKKLERKFTSGNSIPVTSCQLTIHEFVELAQALRHIPEGYALVPVEPTGEMIDAFWGEVEGDKDTKPSDIYKAMIGAAKND